jgi:hypothetical protein
VVHGFGAERGFIVGGSGSGKSTLLERIQARVLTDYPKAPMLLLDTKPRFRAERELNGASAAHRYKHWDYGSPIPGSVVLDYRERNYGMQLAQDLGARIWIFQDEREAVRPLMLDAAEWFFAHAKGPRLPRLLVVDETLDFFSRNGYPVKGASSDILLRVARAGRERGVLGLFATQRPSGIPPQLYVEATKVYLFRLDRDEDVKTLIANGAMPRDTWPPEEDRIFKYYDKRTKTFRLLTLRIPERAA